jgi:AraC-like DNA-binding protein
MLRCSGKPALGFELGQSFTLKDLGVVGYGMSSAATFREAIELWNQYASSLFGTLVNVRLAEARMPFWALSVYGLLPAGECARFVMEEYLGQVIVLAKHLAGYDVKLSALELAYPRPEHHNLYGELFNCNVSFDAPINLITVHRPALDEAILQRDQYLYDIYHSYCETHAGKNQLGGLASSQLRNYFMKNLGSPPRVGQAARFMGISVSTLHRKLAKEGVNYGEVLSDFRQQFAQAYLSETRTSLKQIVYLLGYQDSKPFYRAFKAWTGISCGEYRKRHTSDREL